MTLPAEIKGLFHQLVQVVGGQDAAASFLGVSQPRISQWCNPTCADMPSVLQIVTLERVVQQDVVTGALSRLARNGSFASNDPEKELGDVTLASANVLHLQRTGASPKRKHSAALQLVKEAQEVEEMFRGEGAA